MRKIEYLLQIQKVKDFDVQKSMAYEKAFHAQMSMQVSYINYEKSFPMQPNGFSYPLEINFSKPIKGFQTQMIFSSYDNKDVRIYDVMLTILPIPVKVTIFRNNARLVLKWWPVWGKRLCKISP